jgi:hypothetical protein
MNPGTSARNNNGTLNASHDEARRLVGRIDEEHTALVHWVVRDDPDGHALEPGESDDEFARPERFEFEERTLVEQRVEHLVHVVGAPVFRRHDLRDRTRARDRCDRLGDRRRLQPVRRQVRQKTPGALDGLGVVGTQVVAAAADRGVHAGAAHLVERDVFTDDDFGHAR